MSKSFAPIAALFVSIALVLTGYGLLTILTPVAADRLGLSDILVGFLGTAYFGGLTLGCFLVPIVIARVGHIRAFTAFTALATVTPLLQGVVLSGEVWIVLRIVTGFCYAGISMVIESWLNERADNSNRGFILSTYTGLNLLVAVIGQQMLGLGDPAGPELFILVAIFVTISAIPVALTRSPAPDIPATTTLQLRRLIQNSPVAAGAVFGTGLANGAFWSLAPLYPQSLGMSETNVASFVSAAVIGGAVALWPLGWLSDRRDRRLVIAGICIGAAIASLGLTTLSALPFVALAAIAFLYGATALPAYSLSIAHANDHADPGMSVSLSGSLLLLWGVGATIGPTVAAFAMELGGSATLLFAFTGIAFALLAAFTIYRMTVRPAPTEAQKETFVYVPRTSPAVFQLDPRGEDGGEDEAAWGEPPPMPDLAQLGDEAQASGEPPVSPAAPPASGSDDPTGRPGS
ncbi:MFS transporter [Marinibaculum pumilum]|uniref:MFS transporter n=1 Tax=Marinibaculum pumilum TaxID=1766165 RepID=A0ABV7L8Y5_9PROT